MNENLETKLIESVDTVMEYVEKGAEFAAEEAPLVAQEIVTWGIVDGLLTAFACASFVAIVGGAVAWALKKFDPDGEDMGFVIFIVGAVCVFPFIGACSGVLQAAKAFFAPRLYVLETLGKLM